MKNGEHVVSGKQSGFKVWDINTGAVEGTEEVDETYRLRLGYSW